MSAPTSTASPSVASASASEGMHRRIRRLLGVLIVAFVFGSLLIASLALAQSTGPTAQLATIANGPDRNSHSVTLLKDGRVLVAGGWDGASTSARVDTYDPRTQIWSPAAALSQTRALHTATRLSDDRVLVTGGWDNLGRALTSTEVFAPATGVWIPAAPLQGARAGHVAVPLFDGRVLVAAGCTEAGVRRDAEVYDAATNAWQAAGELVVGRCGAVAVGLTDGRVLMLGGRNQAGEALASAELYDPTRNVWTPAASLTTPREGHTTTLLADGRVLVAGGYNGAYLSSAEIYDPATNTWTSTAAMRLPRAHHAALLLTSGKVWVSGGSAGSRPSLETEIYDPQSGQWLPAEPLFTRYESHLVNQLDDGSVLITGRADREDQTEATSARQPQPQVTPWPFSEAASVLSTGNETSEAIPSAAKVGSTVRQASSAMAQASMMSEATAPSTNFTTGDAARLFGVHEVSFVRPVPTAIPYNPHAITVTVTFSHELTASPVVTDSVTTVMAFYDGHPIDALHPSGDINKESWKARLYVHQVGTWKWSVPEDLGFINAGDLKEFTAFEDSTSQLHGMLRVSSETVTVASSPTPQATYTESTTSHVGTSKRWYTDDGRTFVPMADTAYRLFFQVPTSTTSLPPSCPHRDPTQAVEFVKNYAKAVQEHGINVLRVEALGTWANTYQDLHTTTCGADHHYCVRQDDCIADLSLFWSTDKNGSSNDLFDDVPTITTLSASSESYFPNLKSFSRTDEFLKLLLENFPDLYIQVILLPEPISNSYDHDWRYRSSRFGSEPNSPGVPQSLRYQIWRTMAARWSAFPNVFWSISNDWGDAASSGPNHKYNRDYPNNRALAKEAAEYFTGVSGNPNTPPDPWHNQRPMSVGHLRNEPDSSIGSPWLSYITAYSAADISAQQMDGGVALPEAGCSGLPHQIVNIFEYTSEVTPTLNVEDYYEDSIAHPSYFYRRLLWSYLLSGGGATYGAGATFGGNETYDTAALSGLKDTSYISNTLDIAGIDLGLFEPADDLITVPADSGASTNWKQYNRAQVAKRGAQEIFAYIPNTDSDSTSVYCPDRQQAEPADTSATVTVNLSAFHDASYAVTWYRPYTDTMQPQMIFYDEPITGSMSHNLTAPSSLIGDGILHISSRCQATDACLQMDAVDQQMPQDYLDQWIDDFRAFAFTTTLSLDTEQHIFTGNTAAGAPRAAWRCDRMSADPNNTLAKCLLYFLFSGEKPVVSADYYFRQNSQASHQSVTFITVPTIPTATLPITLSAIGWPATGVDVGFDPNGDIFSDWGEGGYPVTWNVRHGVPLTQNRWHHLEVKARKTGDVDDRAFELEALLDGASVFTATEKFRSGDQFLRGVILHSAWWAPINDIGAWPPATPSIWWDELSVGFPPDEDLRGLYRITLQQGLGNYAYNNATYFDGTGGHDGSAYLRVGANNYVKSLLRFDVATIPANAIVDEANLELYYTGRSNGNSLTLGAHGVLAEWIDAEADRTQALVGASWNVVGMGNGSDYTATSAGAVNLTGAGNAWINLNITNLVQTWVSQPGNNLGLVLVQDAATGYVIYDFCSDVVQQPSDPPPTPCLAGHAPKLTVRYHLVGPAPVKATFQRGANGYAGNAATYFDGAAGYNNATYLRVGADNNIKSLLQFNLSSIPAGSMIDEATLRIFQAERSNANTLTLGAHRVLASWTDAEANKARRKIGSNWLVSGMGSGSDFLAEADGSAALASAGGDWVEIDVTQMVEAWVADPDDNHGLVLTQNAASGFVYYSFCSELGWSPCTAAQAPVLTVWYHR